MSETTLGLDVRTPRQRPLDASLAVLSRLVVSERSRRWLNVAVAAMGIVIAAPLMLLIALLIKLTSPGPVFYIQTRVGIDRRAARRSAQARRRGVDRGGQPFTIYKFRTMRSDRGNGHLGPEVWAKPDDPRITPVGRVLRQYRLDELPQFFNVLHGDMNVVGPRPEQPKIFAKLREQIEYYPQRQRVRPGITGWAQINQPYDSSVDDVRRKVSLDLEYVARQSPLEDLKIMCRTLPVMLFKRGAC